MKNKRIRERRILTSRSRYLMQSAGDSIRFLDRRRYPDRRINSIHAEFIPLEEYYK